MTKLARKLEAIQQRLRQKFRSEETGNLVPWAYGPRPVIQARYILNLHHDREDHSALIRRIFPAMEYELSRRTELRSDPNVEAALKLAAEYVPAET